jgi:hypothetical protein
MRLTALAAKELDRGEVALGFRDEIRWSCVLHAARLSQASHVALTPGSHGS